MSLKAVRFRLRVGLIVFLAFGVAGMIVSAAAADWKLGRRERIRQRAITSSIREAGAEQAIGGLLKEQVACWNRGDLAGFMATYWNSDTLSFSSGKDMTRGWQATFDRYKKRYRGEGQEMGALSFSDLEVEMLAGDSAFVRGRWQLNRSKDKAGGLFTLIVKKLPEGWRIVHDHTSG